jgi:hypothetical protein
LPVSYKEPTLSIPWLAGYAEGEAAFCNVGNCPSVLIASTDLDVIESLQSFVGLGNIHKHKKQYEHWKQLYDWGIYGDSARELMYKLYPMLSQRRQFQIDHALAGKHLINRPNYRTLIAARK